MKDEHKEIKSAEDMLDDLITQYYREIINKQGEKAKIGDLLKMIELKRKLAPAGADQKKFWKMLDKIRKETLEKQYNEPHDTIKKKKTKKKK